jgi:copper(I)-binding protein
MRILPAAFFCLSSLASLAPAFAAPPVAITGAWARATLPHQDEGVAYLTLQSPQGDTLASVASPQAGMVMLHQTEQKNGMADMEDMDSLALPAGKSVALAPGGMHLMLMDLKHPLKAGDTLHLSLVFKNAGSQDVAVPVLSVHATGPAR